MSRQKIVVSTCSVLFLLFVIATGASGDIPKKINYQARLTDSGTGGPITGAHSMTFRIYSVSTGGSPLWTETKSVTADANGVISTVLVLISVYLTGRFGLY